MSFESLKAELQSSPRVWLITGVAGFIGSNLLEYLLKLGQTVHGLDNFSTGTRKNLEEVRNSVSPDQWNQFLFFEGDITRLDDCSRAMKGTEVVLHQAARGSVPGSIEDPLAFNHANVTGFLNILWTAKAQGLKRIVYASSSSVYGDSPGLPKSEFHLGNPLSPYAVTKLVNEHYGAVFSKLYGMEVIGLRYFNIFGKRQDPSGAYAAVIPAWFASLIQGKPVQIYGDGQTSRDFCYIENVIQANLLASAVKTFNVGHSVYNVAGGAQTSLNELFFFDPRARHAVDPKCRGHSASLQRLSPGRHSSLARLHLSCPSSSRIRSSPHSLASGLIETSEWYMHNASTLPFPKTRD